MNREIKIRVWDGTIMRYSDKQILGYHPLYHVLDGSLGELMLYTGVKDKNRAEIYECDIVKAFIGGDCYGIGKVVFHDGIFWIEWLSDREANMEPVGCYAKPFGKVREPLEVIGNVYQNPELLKQAEV